MIVTISREYGAAGLGVADAAANALGYELMTDDLPEVVAARLGTSAEEVAARVAGEESLTERVLGHLGAGTPEMASLVPPQLPWDMDEQVRCEIERAIRERAERGDVVILGRNAGAVLGRRADLVRVFLTAGREWRIERLMEAFHLTRSAATTDLDRVDAARRKFAKERYKIAWGDPHDYELVIETSRFGIEGAAAVVAAAVRAAENH